MPTITIYDPGTGRIMRTVSASEEDCLLNIEDGEVAIEGAHNCRTHYVLEGQAIPFPPTPGDWAVWDWAAQGWTDPRDEAWHAARLAEAKDTAFAQITALRGQARLAYITDIPGQEGIYIAKLEEARAWLAEADPDLSDYPLIASEVGVTAPTADQVAQVFINLNALWKQAAGQIDGACFAAELTVQAAGDVAGVEAAVSALMVLLSGAAP